VNTERLQSFSDNVFAVAVTLLVLNIPIPRHGSLGQQIADQWPAYAAYVLSFATVGVLWVNHHALLDHVVKADKGLLYLNLLLLLFVVLVPHPTGLLAGYLRDTHENARLAVALYGGTMFVTALCFSALWAYVAWKRHLAHPHAQPGLGAEVRRSVAAPVAYLIGTALALLVPGASILFFAGIAVAVAFLGGTWRLLGFQDGAARTEASTRSSDA